MVTAMPEGASDPQVIPYLLYADAGAAMDWLIKTFAFTERVRDKRSDGTVRHGELLLDNGGVIMLGSPGSGFRGHRRRSRRPPLVLRRAALGRKPSSRILACSAWSGHRPGDEPGGWRSPSFPASRCRHHQRLERSGRSRQSSLTQRASGTAHGTERNQP